MKPLLLMHLLAAFTLLVSPWIARLRYQKLRSLVAAGEVHARARRFRLLLVNQAVMIGVVGGLWWFSRIPASAFGLCAPRSWRWSLGLTLGIVVLFAWSAMRLRPKADALRAKMENRTGALLPESMEDIRWFAGISFGSGIAEELVYRGFWFYYLATLFPHISSIEKILVASLVFGIGHFYQGWLGMAGTGAAGFILGGLYILTGSLFVPVVVHALGNMRAVVIFWPDTTRNAAASATGV